MCRLALRGRHRHRSAAAKRPPGALVAFGVSNQASRTSASTTAMTMSQRRVSSRCHPDGEAGVSLMQLIVRQDRGAVEVVHEDSLGLARGLSTTTMHRAALRLAIESNTIRPLYPVPVSTNLKFAIAMLSFCTGRYQHMLNADRSHDRPPRRGR